jgi:LPXTG-site transpeptidase (sortase) family protein
MKKVILAAALFALAIFFIWMIRVLVPITLVEIRYQYKKVLADVFHVSDLRGLIMPQFKLDLKGYTSKYKINGITIPMLFIDEPIIFNVDPNDEQAYVTALKKGIAHASGTGFPGTGNLGYYFAHSSTPGLAKQYNAIFYLLDKLKQGDEIYIWHEGQRTDYHVTKKEITNPTDLSFLTQTHDTETIVLQTCWPPGTTTQRLLVFAEATRE